MKKTVAILSGLVFSMLALAQPIDPVSWTFEAERTGDNEFELVYTAKIDPPWHLYSAYLPENGPIPTRPSYDEKAGFELAGDIVEVTKPTIKFDPGFRMDVGTIAGKAEFRQKVRITAPSVT